MPKNCKMTDISIRIREELASNYELASGRDSIDWTSKSTNDTIGQFTSPFNQHLSSIPTNRPGSHGFAPANTSQNKKLPPGIIARRQSPSTSTQRITVRSAVGAPRHTRVRSPDSRSGGFVAQAAQIFALIWPTPSCESWRTSCRILCLHPSPGP